MAFEKGHTTNVGRKLSIQTRHKMSEAHKELKPSSWGAGFKPGHVPWQVIQARNAYFAGLIDGEGSIFTTYNGIKKPGGGNYKKVNVVITMRKDKAQPLPEGQLIWGGSLNDRKPRKSNINWALDWRMSGRVADGFLRAIFPYLRIKKKQAELALIYLERQHRRKGRKMTEEELEFRKEIEDKIKRLNH
ncbi:hypothetical protein M0R04_13505 [Candidatus Dojkabacteria bacterium]|jgi:hypothetical protein|nr:hypothetical protein [Candidatus Dojkabacteria bacterium]